MAGRATHIVLVLICGLVIGCGKQNTATPTAPKEVLSPDQLKAVDEYTVLLGKQIAVVERTAAILATVQDDAASKQSARSRLLELSIEADLANRRAREQQPLDIVVLVSAKQRVSQQEQKAVLQLREQLRRINEMPGGEDFFQKELRPFLGSLKG